ncbi:MAG: ATP-binding protein [Candidatus Aminicenantales bacterium]
MKKIPAFSLLLGSMVLLVSLYGFWNLRQRAGLPPAIQDASENGRLLAIDGLRVERQGDIPFLLRGRNPGDRFSFRVRTEEGVVEQTDTLVRFYGEGSLLFLYLGIGLACAALGFVVLTLRPSERKARLFYWGSLAFAAAVIINGEIYCLRSSWVSTIPGILFTVAYPLVFVILLDFCLCFLPSAPRWLRKIIIIPPVLFIGFHTGTFLLGALASSLKAYHLHQSLFVVFRFYVVAYTLASLITLWLSFRSPILEEEKAQIKWIFYGLVVGAAPFIVLYQIPRALAVPPLLPENLSQVFFLLIPVALAVAIVRYRLMDIEIVINRSLVYALLTIFIASLYLVTIQFFHNVIVRVVPMQQTLVSVVAAIAAAGASHPARKKIQDFVDRAFFRVSFDYRKSLVDFTEEAHRLADMESLADYFLKKIQSTLPLEHAGLLVTFSRKGRRSALSREADPKHVEPLILRARRAGRILARRSSVRMESGMDFSSESLLEEKGLEMVLPLGFGSKGISGVLTVGRKKSGQRFSRDDIELLSSMGETFAAHLERISLQEEVIYERTEKEKLDELNRLKTEFISNVSHEIRTPMSSLQGISEMLYEGKIRGKKKQTELLDLMARECGRLSRFLHNILDFGRIEQKVKTYAFQETDICEVVRDISEFFRPRMESLGFRYVVDIPQEPLILKVDPDALKQALTNLIDNAIKYSPDRKEVRVHLTKKGKTVALRIEDKGIGIPEQERRRIFYGFYRTSKAQQVNPRGAGLGLKIIRHIIEAHGGNISVESQVGDGSTFTLELPVR